ncbi:glycosyltransferase [bacterium]|nr:glycosyltransferase [bacterium]
MRTYDTVIYGMFKSYYSWAYVLRNLAKNLIDNGADIVIKLKKGIGYDPHFPLPDYLEKRVRDNTVIGKKEIALVHPSLYKNMRGDNKIGILVYETFPLPSDWVENINEYLDELVVPSRFVKDIAARSGVNKPISVWPFPYEIKKVAQRPVNEKFTFLTIATPHKRKNISFMLHGFLEVFGHQENMEFILKTLPEKKSGKLKHWEESVKEIKKEYEHYENVKVIDEYYSDDDIQLLLQCADCYVQLSSSEAFGITIFQALDFGIPVIATNYGGYVEYLQGKYIPVDFSLKHMKGICYGEEDVPVLAALPNWESYKANLREVYGKFHNDPNLE